MMETKSAVEPMIRVENLTVAYGAKTALQDVSIEFGKNRITALIGPSGCGKTTLLRCLNRMNDLIEGVSVRGSIRLGDTEVYGPATDLSLLRRRVGMVFQKTNPFPKTIYENVAYGPRIHGMARRGELDAIVERSLRMSALWDEAKDRLHESALRLSGG